MLELVRLASRRLAHAPLNAIAAALARESPGVAVGISDDGGGTTADREVRTIAPFAPRDPDRAWALDVSLERAAAAGPLTLIVDLDAARAEDARFVDPPRGASPLSVARAAIIRHQRLVALATHPSLPAVLARHDAIYEAADLTRPLVRADQAHARDAWRWVLRLDGTAGVAPQIAALFHDAHAHAHAHARDGDGAALMARALEGLVGLELDGADLDDARALVAAHERTDGLLPDGCNRADLALLNDADALSFFSLNASPFLDDFGPSHTRAKIVSTLARLSPRARRWLPAIALRPDVATLVAEALTAEVCAPSEGTIR